MNCRACGHALQYVHGHGACYFTGCAMHGQNQAPCCEGEVATEAIAAAAGRLNLGKSTFTKDDLLAVLEAPDAVVELNGATAVVTLFDAQSARRAVRLLQERRSAIPPTMGVELRWPGSEADRLKGRAD